MIPETISFPPEPKQLLYTASVYHAATGAIANKPKYHYSCTCCV